MQKLVEIVLFSRVKWWK